MKKRWIVALIVMISIMLAGSNFTSYKTIEGKSSSSVSSIALGENEYESNDESEKFSVQYYAKYDGNIIAKITLVEEINGIDGWKLSEDNRVLTKEYEENVSETISVTTIDGEEIGISINTPIVVFVGDKGSDTNDGKTPEALTTIQKAYETIGDNVGMIVICESLYLDLDLASNKKTITITGSYIDEEGNEKENATLTYSKEILLNGPTRIENITLGNSYTIYAQGNDLTIGYGVSTLYSPSIYGGFYVDKTSTIADVSCSDYTIEINSGTWKNVIASNFRNDTSLAIGKVGNVTTIINGGTFGTKNGNNIIAVGGYSEQSGDYLLKINGGTIYSNIYGIARGGINETSVLCAKRGNVDIQITGGTLYSKEICAMQDKTEAPITGDYTLIIDGASLKNLENISISAENVEGTANAMVPNDCLEKLEYFGANIYVCSDDSNPTISSGILVNTLEEAFANEELINNGGNIIICGEVEANSSELKESKKNVLITGTFYGKDYNGSIKLAENLNLKSNVIIQNVRIVNQDTDTEKVINANGNNLTIGKGMKVDGNITIDAGSGENTHTTLIESGTWSQVIGGKVTSENEYSIIRVTGGTIGNIYGTGSEGTIGSVNIVIEGGTILGKIYESTAEEGKIKKNAGVLILNNSEISFETLNNVDSRYEVSDYRQENDASVIFLKNDGDNNNTGSTPELAVQTINNAFNKLVNEGGKIVVCGETNIDTSTQVKSANEKVTITSVYKSIDYRKVYGGQIRLDAGIAFQSEVEITGIELVATSNDSFIVCRGNEVIFGEDINCDVWFDRGVNTYTTIIGGANKGTITKDVNIIIKSGTWGPIIGGNRSTNGVDSYEMKNNITLNIEGGTFKSYITPGNMGNMTGNIELNISGGTFDCSIYAIPYATTSRTISSTMAGNICVNITGGNFLGDILAKQGYTKDPEENYIIGIEMQENYIYKLNIDNTSAKIDMTRVGAIRGLDEENVTSQINFNNSINFKEEINTQIEYLNPIEYNPDPSIFYYNGWYYYTYSSIFDGHPGIAVKKAVNLCDIENAVPVQIWCSGDSSTISGVWGPQMYFDGDDIYIYAIYRTVNSNEGSEGDENTIGFPIVLKAENPDNPQGDYGDMAKLQYGYYDENNKLKVIVGEVGENDNIYTWLSPRLFQYNGKTYLVCGGVTNDSHSKLEEGSLEVNGKIFSHYQEMLLVEMLDATTINVTSIIDNDGNITIPIIMSATQEWEMIESGEKYVSVIEGAFPIFDDEGNLYVTYSTGSTYGSTYCTGMLKFIGGIDDSLTDASKWAKYANPIHKSNTDEKITSTGAMVFTQSQDNEEMLAVYHAKLYANTGYRRRYLFMTKARVGND